MPKQRTLFILVAAIAVMSLDACSTAPRSGPVQWWQNTGMQKDAHDDQTMRPGTVAQVEPVVRYVFKKTPACGLEPKALNAFAQLSPGRWILRKTSSCYITYPGQVIEVDLDSGKVVRKTQYGKPQIGVGDRVWVVGDGVTRIPDGNTSVLPVPGVADLKTQEGVIATPLPVIATPRPVIATPIP